jgi:hypothetical protein
LRPIAAIGIGATAALAGTLVGITTIWGQEFGGLLAVIVGLIIFWFRWRRHRSQMTASNG